MTKIKGIVRLEGRGITATVTDVGTLYTTYQTFADGVGYSDAAYELGSGNYKADEFDERVDEVFTVLAKGLHGSQPGVIIYVIESADGKRFLVGEDGLEITENDHAPKSLATRKQAEELLAELRRQAYAEGYEQGFKQAKFDAEMEEQFRKVSEVVTQETAQEKRDRIVEQAKADVEDLFFNGIGSVGKVVEGHAGHNKVEFIVNRDNRTVVALLRLAYVGSSKVYKKGIAKCAPGDCFNEHIGKAIAIRRALGLEVPDEYLNAPQPTEVRVADIIEWEYSKRRYRVIGIRRGVLYNFINIESGERFYDLEYRNLNSITKIVDDSHDEFNEEADAIC